MRRAAVRPPWAAARLPPLLIHRVLSSGRPPPLGGGRMLQRSGVRCLLLLRRPLLLLATLGARTWRSSPSIERLMAFRDFLDFLEFLETSEVAGPGPNPREIEISFGAEGPLACARPDPTIGWTDVLPCVFVCVWGRYPPAAALLVRRLVVPVLNKLLQLPLHPLAGAWRVRLWCARLCY